MSSVTKDFSGDGFPASLFPEIKNGGIIEDFLVISEKKSKENNLIPRKKRTLKQWLSLSGIENRQQNQDTMVKTSFTVPSHITELPGCDCKREKENFPFIINVDQKGNIKHNCSSFSFYNKRPLENGKVRKRDNHNYDSYFFSHF